MRDNRQKTHQNLDRNKNERDSKSSRNDIRSESFSRDRSSRNHNSFNEKRGGKGRFFFHLGQLFGLVYNLAVLYFVYTLVEQQNEQLALKIFVINAAVMISAMLISLIERKFFSRSGRFDKKRFNRR